MKSEMFYSVLGKSGFEAETCDVIFTEYDSEMRIVTVSAEVKKC